LYYSKKVEQLLPTLTVAEKIGQLFILAFAGEDSEYAKEMIKNYHVGGFYITDDNANSLADAKNLSTKLQQQAVLRSCDAALLLAVDQEGAWGILTQETDLGPGNLALGSANNLANTETMYQIFAQQMQAIGYNTLLSPCADVNSNPDNPIIGQRSFGETPENVADHVAAAVKGIDKTGNLACAKHFPGHGDTAVDSHRSLPTVNKSLEKLLNEDLVPFIKAIEQDVALIMTAHINYPKIDDKYPATLSKKILTGLLKTQLGFNGLIITDSMNMWAMRKNYSPSEAAILSLKAGAHMVMLSEEHYENEATPYKQIQQETIQGVIDAVDSGELELETIDHALKHVLSFKYQRLDSPKTVPKLTDLVCQGTAQLVAEQALKVLKNDYKFFPIGQKKFYITCAANPLFYEKLVNSRGIGPNDAIPASQVFIAELRAQGANFIPLSYEYFSTILSGESQLNIAHPLIMLTEDYPLPGEDFDLESQLQRVKQSHAIFGNELLVLALRSDYELKKINELGTYVCAYSSRSVSAKALAKQLLVMK